MPDSNQTQNTDNQQNNTDTQNQGNTTAGCVYDKYGRSPDKKTICGIGLKSATADTGEGFQKAVFENKCPHCGNASLMWGWHWEDDPEKVAMFDGTDGATEGHFYCVQSQGGCDADYSAQGNEHINGSTYNMTPISGPEPSTEEEAKQLVSGQLPCVNGTGGGTNTAGGGGTAIKIPDLTFYGLIKQILGAVDGVFIIANNMAYLLSFKQFYKYRNDYEDYIPELTADDIVVDSVIRNWATDGFYNAVEVTYADGIIKYQHDALVSIYGENVFYYEFTEDDEETAKAKAKALLSAHVRDYSLDLQLNCVYNPNISVGSWLKVPKTLTKMESKVKTSGEIGEAKEDKKKVRKGVNITNINEVSQKIDGGSKTVQEITTEDGEQYDVEIEKKDYEIYFVQSYKMTWTPQQAPLMSLHLKYGPDTPEDPVNATIGTGGISTSANSQFGDDCFYIGAIMPNNNATIGEHGPSAPDLHKSGFEPQEEQLKARCKQGSNLAKDAAGKKPQEIHNFIRQKFGYCYYADCSSLWPCVSDMYDQACGANCADTTRILKCALDAAGIKNWGVHVSGHYFNALELNGEWVCIDGTGSYEWSNTAGWPAGPKPAQCCEPNQAESDGNC